MLKRVFLAMICLSAWSANVLAQQGLGTIQGKVKDKTTGELLPFVSIAFEQNGLIKHKAETDYDGEYKVASVTPGTYSVKFVVTGYKTKQINGFVVKSGMINFMNGDLESSENLLEVVEIVEYQVPLIDKDGGASGGTITRDEIAKMPARSVTSMAMTIGGVYSQEGGTALSIRGARSDANYYYIDGVKVRGSVNMPKSAVEEIKVMTGGMDASYGDATGGIISITTRGASSKFFGGVEVITSGFRFGGKDTYYDRDLNEVGKNDGNRAFMYHNPGKTYGLDHFAYNLIEGSLSGPLWMKKDTAGNKTKPILGFFVSGNYTNQVDNRPFRTDQYVIKQDKWLETVQNPLRPSPSGTGVIYATDYLKSDDFEKVKYRWDAESQSASLAGKIDVNTGPNITLTFGGQGDFNKYRNHNFNNTLFNSGNNGVVNDLTWRVYGRFIQRFNNEEEEAPAEEGAKRKKGIKNAYYTVMVDYSKFTQKDQDPIHKDRLFNYGYVGQFTTYKQRSYDFGNPTGNTIEQNGFADTLVTFNPAPDFDGDGTIDVSNGDLAAITSQYYAIYANDPVDHFQSLDDIRLNNALRNGDAPSSVYDIWNNIGTRYNSYGQTNNSQFRITASGNADIGKHAITVGFEYEQRNDRFFQVSPYGLWTLGRLLENKHLAELNKTNPMYQQFGTFSFVNYDPIHGSTPYTNGPNGEIIYQYGLLGDYDASVVAGNNGGVNYPGEQQSFFDYNIRKILGMDPRGLNFIDIDSYDPTIFKLEYFSAEELLNAGNGYVNYSGYTHYGEKTKGKSSLDDFFNATDEYGNKTRPVASFQPIYNAVFVMDKFAFDDLIFNVGLRVDRFDANQPVLKDKFLFYDAKTVKELANFDHPTNIGEDFVVYGNDVVNPTDVVGYRDGSQWYNASGLAISDPTVLFTPGGIAPFLVEQPTPGQGVSRTAFTDYKPQINVSPRIAFSFPISDEALFFAHYDVLTKRPTTGNRLDLFDYYYVNTRTGLGQTLNNPNLKPEKTIDYELGFQQVLSKSSSIKISGFYKELRNMVTIVNVIGAYPKNYKSYDNIDFGTVKGVTVSYDLRKTQNLTMRASYTLQFAEGTGSDAGSSLNLINTGQPNLRTLYPFSYDQRHGFSFTVDYRYGEGKDYNGPRLFKKDIFANTGINIVNILGSGTPYSTWQFPGPQAYMNSNASSPLAGQVNGARKPGQFRMNVNIDKNILLKWGKKGGEEGAEGAEAAQNAAKTANLNIYLWIENLLNTNNILNVYNATGNPQDDGYLTEARWQNAINLKNDVESFQYYYSLKANSPYNYGLPRTIRLGARLDF